MASIDAYKKFAASAPQAQREFRTLELYHPDFLTVNRYVKDFEDQTLTLDSDAPRNPDEAVVFTAIAAEIQEPGEKGDIEQVLAVSLGAVGNEVQDLVDQITANGSLTPIECIYRKYYSGDLTQPVLVLTLYVSDVAFDSYTGVGFTAEDTNFATKRAGELYTIERFPTLANA
jgi:hypothetical protein